MKITQQGKKFSIEDLSRSDLEDLYVSLQADFMDHDRSGGKPISSLGGLFSELCFVLHGRRPPS